MKTHAIHNVRISLPAKDYTDAVRQQAEAKHWVLHSLTPMLDQHLTGLATEDEIVLIEKIELVITDFPWNLSDEVWQQKLAASIRLAHASVDTPKLVLKQWLFYLQHGCFEKAALLKSARELERYLLANKAQLPESFLHGYNLRFSRDFLQRLFLSHPAGLVQLFLEKGLGLEEKEVQAIYHAIVRLIPGRSEEVIEWMNALLETVLSVYDKQKRKLLAEQLLKEELVQPPTKSTGRSDVQKGNPEAKYDKAEELIYLDCPLAGLVLLLPYIKPFFENCGLLEGTAFGNDALQQTAIQSLYFLATGESIAPEEELILPKLLCGVDLEKYVVFKQELPLLIKAEATDLLHSVITHWTALRNTSVEGLRETFLRRQGRLIYRDEAYTLQVEESGVDVLLNSIPWGFRNYKLPWMTATLLTEWY